MQRTLHDLMVEAGVGNHPEWFGSIALPFWPMDHQIDMIKTYPWKDRFGDFSEPGCVSADTEFLTPAGWKRIDAYEEGDQVAQFHPDDRSMSFVKPSTYIKQPCDEMFVVRPSRGLSMKLSADHRVLHYAPGGNHYRVDRMDRVAEIHEEQVTGFRGLICSTPTYSGHATSGLTEAQMRVMVMVMADGTFPCKTTDRCVIRVLKERKKIRCRNLLNSAGLPFRESLTPDGYTTFGFYAPIKTKTYPKGWYHIAVDERAVILDEVRHWDGSLSRDKGAFRFTSLHKPDVDFIQFVAMTCGKNCTTKSRLHRINSNWFTEHTALVGGKGLLNGIASSSNKTPITKEPTEDGLMYCFTVPSSFLVLRREGRVFTTGNCGKTLPAQVHSIFMAAMGNRVVFTTLPGLIPQFMAEFEVFFPGVTKHLKIEHLDCTADQKKKKERQWDVEGWPDILVLSYDIYRLYNDKNLVKKIGNNQWKIRNTNELGTPLEFATSFFLLEDEPGDNGRKKGEPRFPNAQPYTKDGRMINKAGKATNPKRLQLKEHGYNVLFFDEGDALCGMESILSESVYEMSIQLKGEIALYVLTGTPIPTKLHNAYGLIRLINPDAYHNKAAFVRQHCEMKEFGIPLPGGKVKMIREIVDYFNTEKIYDSLWKNAHRVQKRDVIPMPEPIISEVPVRLSGRHLKLYRQVINDRFAVLGDRVLAPDNSSALRHMALELISCPSKFDPTLTECDELAKATGDLVESINPGPKRKLIIFAFYRGAIEQLAMQFAHRKTAIIYGGISNRQEQLDKFLYDDECDTIIIQWVSGGAGLNLQVAGYIIFYECPTSPKAAKQAIARADRKGQVNIVNVYFMRVLGTLSDRNFKALLANEASNNRAIKDKHDLLHELLG